MRVGTGSLVWVVVFSSAAACGSSVDTEPQSSGSTSASASTGANTGGSGAAGGSGGDAAAGGGTAGGEQGGAGSECGGSSGKACGANEYCELGPDCASDGAPGTCKPTPDCSNSGGFTACGCDGNLYGFPCLANAAGVTTTWAKACEAPPGGFPCGDRYCELATQYCETISRPNPDQAYAYNCVANPPECGAAPTCDCVLAASGCRGTCSVSDEGAITLDCVGGG